MADEEKAMIVQDLELKIGNDITNLGVVYQVENDLVTSRNCLLDTVCHSNYFYTRFSAT